MDTFRSTHVMAALFKFSTLFKHLGRILTKQSSPFWNQIKLILNLRSISAVGHHHFLIPTHGTRLQFSFEWMSLSKFVFGNANIAKDIIIGIKGNLKVIIQLITILIVTVF